MNQQQLQNKRRKRQAKRKNAQVTAKRRGFIEKKARIASRTINAGAIAPKLVDRLRGFLHLGGTQITPDQMDSEPAAISGGEAR